MMHRKKHAGGGRISPFPIDDSNSPNSTDDGGSAKRKGRSRNIAASTALTITNLSTNMCLPGVPVALKLVLLSFIAFAVLMVMTAKVRRAHFHYKHKSNNDGGLIRGVPGMPVPLVDQLKQKLHFQSDNRNSHATSEADQDSEDSNSVYALSSSEATKRMLAQPSKFVDAEKKLKQQLLSLLEKQMQEQKNHGAIDPKDSILGVKISNRYLGEDILPYPESKQAEGEWEKKMNKRKEELRKEDEIEWKALMDQYNEIMVEHVEENEHADHKVGLHHDEPDYNDNKSTAQKPQQPVSKPNNPVPHDDNATWPAPSRKAGDDATILLKPAFGSHRPSSNAILVFAEGYDLSIYLSFVESLTNTGYSGDVVFSISNESKLKAGVKEYLMSKSNSQSEEGVNIIAYEVEWSCFKKSGETARGSGEGINNCKMNNVFGDAAGSPVDDPREPRPVATARYELYWMWSLQYNKESWLMLLDVRDVWFQLNPFEQVNARGKVSGELHLFGENADAVRIGTSAYNKGWLVTAYGRKTVSQYFDEPVICSGSTMGNQDAIETYLRAMVAQFDATKCKSKGCDQGFHNYLYYSGQLGKVDDETTSVGAISKLVVHEQGKGVINNLGALRTKPLKEWGMYDSEKELVLNWDGSTSPVAHQYDRDKEVNIMVKVKKKQFEEQWRLARLKAT